MKRNFKVTFFLFTTFLFSAFFMLCASASALSLECENTVDGIRVEWGECEGVYYYEVYRSSGKKGEKTLLSKVQTTFYEDTGAKEGKSYNYTVVPVFSDYSSGQESEEATAYRVSPTFISGAASLKDGILIKWKKVPEAKGYRLYRRSGSDGEWMTVGKFDAKTDRFIDGQIASGQKCVYTVRAYIGESEGAAGDEKQLSYIGFPVLSGISVSESGIKLSWEETDEAAYYVVYRKTSNDIKYKPIALLDADYTEYEDKSAVAGDLCSYYVCSADADGNMGSYDKEVSARLIEKSVITSAVNTAGGIKLTWSKSKGCQGYAIFRKEPGKNEWKLRGMVYGEGSLSATDSKVENKKTYTYTVRAFRDKDLASYDDEGVKIRFYQSPAKVSCKTDKKSGNTVTWSEVKGSKHYAVYRKESGGQWSFLGITAENDFNDKGIKKNKKYIYGVEVYDGSVLRSGIAETVIK